MSDEKELKKIKFRGWDELAPATREKFNKKALAGKNASWVDFEILRLIAFDEPGKSPVQIINAALAIENPALNAFTALARQQFKRKKPDAEDITEAAGRAALKIYSFYGATGRGTGKGTGSEPGLDVIILSNLITKMRGLNKDASGQSFATMFEIAEKIIEGKVAASYPKNPKDREKIIEKNGRDIGKEEFIRNIMSRPALKEGVGEEVGLSHLLMRVITSGEDCDIAHRVVVLINNSISGHERVTNFGEDEQKPGIFWQKLAGKPTASELLALEFKAEFKDQIRKALDAYIKTKRNSSRVGDREKITPEQANDIFMRYFFPEDVKSTLDAMAGEYSVTGSNIQELIKKRIEFLQDKFQHLTPEDLFPSGRLDGGGRG